MKFVNFEINYFKIFKALMLVKARKFLKNLSKIEKLQ